MKRSIDFSNIVFTFCCFQEDETEKSIFVKVPLTGEAGANFKQPTLELVQHIHLQGEFTSEQERCMS